MNEKVTFSVVDETPDAVADLETVQAAEPVDEPDAVASQALESADNMQEEAPAADPEADTTPEQEMASVTREYIGYEHYSVIDSENRYVTLVLCNLYSVGEEIEIEPKYYKLQEDYRIVKKRNPTIRLHAGQTGFVDPVWDADTEVWAEGLDAEQLAVWEAEHPAPEVPDPPEPSEDLEDRVAALEKAQAEIWSAQAAAIREGVNSVD